MTDLGRLLRMKQMIDASASLEPSAEAGGVLAETYLRLRESVSEIAAELDLEDEFDRHFPVIQVPRELDSGAALRSMVRRQEEARVAATVSNGLLRQLAAWVAGLIDEQTMEARVKAEAEARVRAEGRPPMGY